MTASYPGTIPSFTTKVDNTDINFAADINRVQDEIRALAQELGTNARGPMAHVRGRLEALTAGDAPGQVAPEHHHDARYFRRELVEAKGDLIGGTGANTAARLGVGTSGQFLTADPTQPTSMRWRTVTHGDLAGLGSDDHPQYLDEARHAAVNHTGVLESVSVKALSDWSGNTPSVNDVPRWDGTRYIPGPSNAQTLQGLTPANLRARSSHTGTQPLASITGHTKAVHDNLGINHASLSNLGSGDPHPQYLRPGATATISAAWNFTTRPTVAGNNVLSTPSGGRNVFVQSSTPTMVDGDIWIRV